MGVVHKNYNIYSYIVLLEEDAIFDSSDYAFPYAKSVKVVVESYSGDIDIDIHLLGVEK